MIITRKSSERGHADHGWLDTYHTFSFNTYYDQKFMGFRHLRVINEDYVKAGNGFGTHPHNDMEIITYIVKGALEHKDSMGNGSVIRRGDIQRMSAGTGVMHSEFNPSSTEDVHLLQIWIFPEKRGIEPSYEEKRFDDSEKVDTLRLLVSKDGENGSVRINQDAKLYSSILNEGKELTYTLDPARHAWLQVIGGSINVNGSELRAGDGAGVKEESELKIKANEKSEFLLFDLV